MPCTIGKAADQSTDDFDTDGCSADETAARAYCPSSCIITSDTIATFHTYFSYREEGGTGHMGKGKQKGDGETYLQNNKNEKI